MASIQNKKIGFVEEIVAGTIPTNPKFQTVALNKAEATFTAENESIDGNNTTKGRGVAGGKSVGLSSNASVALDLNYGFMESPLIKSAMWNDWDEKIRSTITADATSTSIIVDDETGFAIGDIVACKGSKAVITGVSANQIDVDVALASALVGYELVLVGVNVTGVDIDGSKIVSTGSFNFTNLDIVVGQYIKVAGFTTAENNAWVRVLSVSSTEMIVDVTPTGWTDEVVAGAIEFYIGDTIIDGSIKKSLTAHVDYTDLSSGGYRYMRGLIADTLDITAESKGHIACTAEFLGLETLNQTTPVAGQTDVASYEANFMDASNNIGRFVIDGQDLSDDNIVTAYGINIANNVSQLWGIGSKYPQIVDSGNFVLTGNLTVLLNDIEQFEKAANNQDLSICITNTIDSQSVLFNIPRLNFTGIDESTSDNTIVADQSFSAKESQELGYTLMVQKFEAFA